MKGRNAFMYALGGVITILFFGTLGLAMFNPIPETNKDLVNIMLGFTGSAFSLVVGYFFGSSKGSADKSEMMAQANGSQTIGDKL